MQIIMEFEFSLISVERCIEIDEMNIVCPYRYTNEKLHVKGYYFVHDTDEKFIFGIGFLPIPAERDYNPDVYILFIDKEYFFIYFEHIEVVKVEKKDNIEYCQYNVFMEDNEKIDRSSNKEEILNLLKQMIPIQKAGYSFNNRVVTIELYYRGERV